MGVRTTDNTGTPSNPKGLNTSSDGHLLEYFRNNFGAGGGGTNAPPGIVESGLTASGGVVSDYSDSGTVYRAHIFTTSGAFTVTDTGSFPSEIDYLVVAGGGGGGEFGGGGGGGFREGTLTVSTSPGSYAIVVGGGGVGDGNGSPSTISSTTVVATGGGAGGDGYNPLNTPAPGQPGGSGGGGGYDGGKPPGATVASPDGRSPTAQGYAGGPGTVGNPSVANGAGGGGAGGAGSASAYPSHPGGPGGIGKQTTIAGPPATNQPIGTTGPNPGGGYLAGGGGGAAGPAGSAGAGGAGGGAPGQTPSTPQPTIIGAMSTGGGGGSGRNAGGSGIVAVRYQIGTVDTGDAKASGGAISFYNNKTIHTFTSTGNFTTPGSFSETCEYVVVGGGGGAFTGGGGAGGYRTGTTPIGSGVNYTITIGAGGNATTPIANPSSIGTIPIAIPGGGNSRSGPDGGAQTGASGGGGVQGGGGSSGGSATGSPYPGSIGATPSSGWGHAGGAGTPADKSGGGGGGATTTGYPGSGGGEGIQLPTTFRDPNGFQYDKFPDHPYRLSTSAGYFVAGGGAGTVYTPFPQASPPLGPTPYSNTYPGMGGRGGGGCRNPADPRYPVYGFNGMANTGGGGAGGTPATPIGGARGGSGLVLIAYPT
tara:strand:- start:203 stop:2143 length:1941 start_codon:yes stop_codon:yes gene_type:complete